MLMNMENENVKPSYEELQQAYQQLLQQAQELDRRYQALLQDRMLEKIKVVSSIMEHKDVYSEKIIKLAEWHLAQMLAKPKA
jgi:hypothetical protein